MADTMNYAAVKTPQQYCGVIADFLQENPQAWIRNTFAVTESGRHCDPRSPAAIAFCALGLLQKFVPDRNLMERCEHLLSRVITPYGGVVMRSVASFNDNDAEGVRDVIAMFRAASYLPEPRESRVRFNELMQTVEAEWTTTEAAVAEISKIEKFMKSQVEAAEAALIASFKMVEVPKWLMIGGSGGPAANDAPEEREKLAA